MDPTLSVSGGLLYGDSDSPHFGAQALAEARTAMSDLELDTLQFGVVEMAHDCTVLRYNAAESRLSGLPSDRVIGRQFFREVAPCCNNARVAQRFGAATLDVTISHSGAALEGGASGVAAAQGA